jgi:hypothetical protein
MVMAEISAPGRKLENLAKRAVEKAEPTSVSLITSGIIPLVAQEEATATAFLPPSTMAAMHFSGVSRVSLRKKETTMRMRRE